MHFGWAGDSVNKTFFLILIAVCLNPFAVQKSEAKGGRDGGGGSVVVERNEKGEITGAKLYDLVYDDVDDRVVVPHFGGSKNLSVQQNYKRLISILARVNPTRAARYLECFADFNDPEQYRETSTPFDDTSDRGGATLPNGKPLEVAIYQRINPDKNLNEVRFKRYLPIWKAMDSAPDHQAATILHECIYGEAMQNGAMDSRYVRHLVSLIAENKLENLGLQNYSYLLKKMNFKDFDYQGLNLSLVENWCWLDLGNISSVCPLTLSEEQRFEKSYKVGSVEIDLKDIGSIDQFGRDHDGRQIRELILKRVTDVSLGTSGEFSLPLRDKITVGSIISGALDFGEYPIMLNGRKFILSGKISFYKNGQIESASEIHHLNNSFKRQTYKFSPDGILLEEKIVDVDFSYVDSVIKKQINY